MPDALPENTRLPTDLFVQEAAGVLVVNRSPLGALQQPLANAGGYVGIYKLERVVALRVEVPVAATDVAAVRAADASPAASPALVAAETPAGGGTKRKKGN